MIFGRDRKTLKREARKEEKRVQSFITRMGIRKKENLMQTFLFGQIWTKNPCPSLKSTVEKNSHNVILIDLA